MAAVIHTEDLAVSFDGVTPVFEGLNLAIEKGEFVTLVGVSGAGGCQQGMACGNSALAVGQSTTKAVVMGIVYIVISASVLTVVYINLGI